MKTVEYAKIDLLDEEDKPMGDLYAQVRYKDRLPPMTSDVQAMEQRLNTDIATLIHARHAGFGECHSRCALPEALVSAFNGFHPLARIAAATAILKAEEEAGNIERAIISVEDIRVTARWKD